MRALSQRRGLRLGALALLVIATGVGTAVGLAQTGGDESQARLRVEAPAEAVACGDRFPVTVYLDELQARPSPYAKAVDYGLGALGLRLKYDPQVLRVEEGPDAVQPNPDLAQVDPDADGKATLFQPIGPFVDNNKGEVFFVELWVGMNPDTKQPEEGPSPAWAGGPLPLFTVTFLANAAGTSPLTLADVEMTDPGEGWYTPVALEQGSATASGEEGKCPELPLPTASPAPPVTPTLTLTPTPTTTPTPEGVGRGSQPVAPVLASEGGRPDCPAGWYVYKDPDGRFSMCYPAALSARSERTSEQTTIAYLSTPLGKWPSEPAVNYVSIAINILLPGWKDNVSCQQAAKEWGGLPVEDTVLTLSGVQARICQGRGPTEDAGYDPLQAIVPIGADGTSLLIFAYKTGPDVSVGATLVEQVLRTLAPGPGR